MPRLFLIDSFGFLYRAYHARARSSAPPMRTRAGMPTEMVYIFHNMLRKLRDTHHPDLIAAIFESETGTLRHQEFEQYKANRAETPPEFLTQLPPTRRLLEALRIPILEFPGYEADDVIGTLARRATSQGYEVVIVSSDKDLLQLVDNHVSMLNPAKDDEWYDPAKVREFLGVEPSQVADLLALKGDAVDNIPGAPGIGDKGARDIISQFGSVEAALDRAAEVQKKTYRESLQNHREQIELSKRLAVVATEVPLECELTTLQARDPDPTALADVYREMEFFSLLKELPAGEAAPVETLELTTAEAASAWAAKLDASQPLAVCLGTIGEGLLVESRFGLATSATQTAGLSADHTEALRPLLESDAPKIAHDAKALLLDLEQRGIHPGPIQEDVMLYAFLVDADPGVARLESAAARFLNRKPGDTPEQAAGAIWALADKLRPEVDELGLRGVYDTIDLPLIPVLARMERTGVRIDPQAMGRMSARMDLELQHLTEQIYAAAGHPFNINSPQQLGKVLFEELDLPTPVTRGKKAPSTAADVLESLAPQYPIAGSVLEYRQIAKLKGTYVDALPSLIRSSTGRLHTSFNPVGAATGRLSSSNPNLQNIPIRTELGREIRAAFVPEPGWTLVVADYSQIELRLLAHLSADPVLTDSFRKGEDIHTRTAAEVFGIPPDQVTADLRRNAKAVNFGIIYGLSAFGLAGQLSITRQEAEQYIHAYFERYAGVREFIDRTIAEVKQSGFTRTMFGRRRPIPDIAARNPAARGFAERTAVNTPLQGTAADLIKLAMIAIDRRLRDEKWQSRMLLQVHDELVFEAPPDEVAALRELARREMTGVFELNVPLVVDTGAGDNWRDAK